MICVTYIFARRFFFSEVEISLRWYLFLLILAILTVSLREQTFHLISQTTRNQNRQLYVGWILFDAVKPRVSVNYNLSFDRLDMNHIHFLCELKSNEYRFYIRSDDDSFSNIEARKINSKSLYLNSFYFLSIIFSSFGRI